MIRSGRNSSTGRECNPWPRRVLRLLIVVYVSVCGVTVVSAQQKSQHVPGQFDLNAGVVPDPGLYENLVVNYSAGRLNNQFGNPSVTSPVKTSRLQRGLLGWTEGERQEAAIKTLLMLVARRADLYSPSPPLQCVERAWHYACRRNGDNGQ